MSQKLFLRPMTSQDIKTLVRNFSFPWSTPEKTLAIWQNYYEEQKKGIRTVAVLEQDSHILGYGSLLRNSEYPHFSQMPEINAIWIDEKHRRQGLGKRLIEWLEDLARQEGYKKIGLGVGLYRDYGSAQKLYFQLGYAPDGYGATYKHLPVTPGKNYPVDDDFILWLVKTL